MAAPTGVLPEAGCVLVIADAAGIPVVSFNLEGTAVGNIARQLIALKAVKDLKTFRRLLSAHLQQKTYVPR
jgi:rhamnulokinase